MYKKTLLFTALLGMGMILSSCFVDYGLDSENYDLVATSYNSSYNFGAVTKFAVVDTIVHYGEDPVSHDYDTQIITKVADELTGLGWVRVYDSTANVVVNMGTTSTTTVVYGSSYGWDYGWYYDRGAYYYSWYYPYYPTGYSYSYEYETGSLVIRMVDLRLAANEQVPVQWVAVLNALMGSPNVSSRINAGIDQAFTQSPYLK